MKTIAFFIRNVSPDALPFSSRHYYFYSYQQYLLAIKRAGAKAYFVTGNDSYHGHGRFSRAWTINHVSKVADFTPVKAITADVVFNKAAFAATDVPVVTSQSLWPILNDKSVMYQTFGDYQPKTIICDNADSLRSAIAAMPGSRVVIKNPTGSCGKQVYIGTKAIVTIPASETYPLIVQEFIDMSAGIPGLISGPHDFRILIAGGTIIGATIRQPANGHLHANVSQGGSQQLLDVPAIPEEVKKIALTIDGQLENVPRYYSVDVALGPKGWKVIELNDKPGLFPERTGPLARVFMDRLAKYMLGLAS